MMLRGAPEYLIPGGLVALELGMGQSEDVADMAKSAGLEILAVRKDLASIDRILLAKRP
jgi:release factor glutamine methyltransferase